MNLYSELDPYPAEWLRNLVREGHIPDGRVVGDIAELTPADLRYVLQFHAFAGIGAWSYALRLAGWPSWIPVWTGSCLCQPFSNLGKRKGTDDARHLWPEWRRLIGQCQPPVLFGEQVGSRAGREWLAAVRADLEALGYAVGAADLCAAGVGAPHIRQRLYFTAVRLAYAPDWGRAGRADLPRPSDDGRQPEESAAQAAGRSEAGSGVGDTISARLERYARDGDDGQGWAQQAGPAGPPGWCGYWAAAEWVQCSDQKQRPIEPGTFPLAHGAAAHVGRLRAYGNAIVPQVAAAFIRATMSSLGLRR